jgi:hypothetical protein
VFLCGDSRCLVGFQVKSICFLNKRPYVTDSFSEHQPDLSDRLTARGLLYECVCVTPSLFHVTSTYWKHASGTSPLDLPLVGVSTFLEGPVSSPDRVQVEDSSGSHDALSSLQAPGSALQRLDVRLRMRPGGFFFFGSPCTLRDFIAVTSSPCFNMTSSLPLRPHVDRGLVRHG